MECYDQGANGQLRLHTTADLRKKNRRDLVSKKWHPVTIRVRKKSSKENKRFTKGRDWVENDLLSTVRVIFSREKRAC